MKSVAWLGFLAMTLAFVIGGCGGDDTSEGLSYGTRCVIAQEDVKDCIDTYCKSGKGEAFCACYANQGRDLDVDGCGCSVSSLWNRLEGTGFCDDLPADGHVSCASLGLQRYDDACGPS